MTTTPTQLTTEQAVAFINSLEGTGYDSVDFIVGRLDDADAAAIAWCKAELGKDLDTDEAWNEVTEWCEKENVPLKGKFLELCQKEVQDGIDGNNGSGWLSAHHAAVIRYALVESFDEQLESVLSEFAEFVYADAMDGLPSITGFQYLEAAKPVIKANVELRVKAQGIKGIFESALSADEQYLGNPRKLLKAYVERHPEHTVALVEALLNHPYLDLEEWLCTEDWYSGLEEGFTAKAKEIYTKACVDWDCEGEDVLKELSTTVRQALAKGGVGSDEILDDAEVTAELAELKAVSPTPQVGAELLKRVAAMEQAGVAPKDILIRTGYYTEGGDYGQSNVNFFSAKLAAQKADGSWEKAQQESKAKEAAQSGFDVEGKRICITGKLKSPRHEMEGWLADMGATVVSGVSKTTDALIVGEKAGSKLDKAKELGIKLLTEEQALEALSEVIDGVTAEWAKRIIDRLLSSVPDADAAGYFKVIDRAETVIPDASNKTEMREWLKERVGTDSSCEQYVEFEDALALKLVWIELNTTNNVTAWYFDNEYGGMDDYVEVTLNNHQDVRRFLENKNSGWGGHLSIVKVIQTTGKTVKVFVGDELNKAQYSWGSWEFDHVLDNLDSYPELGELLSDDPEDAGQELLELIRKGLWPKPPVAQ